MVLVESAVVETLGSLVVIDGKALAPAIAEFEQVRGRMMFPNFLTIAGLSESYGEDRGAEGTSAPAVLLSSQVRATVVMSTPPVGREPMVVHTVVHFEIPPKNA
ncbi:MAG: hypothetical protein WAK40_02255 [Thermoplasmata archaeon]